MDNLSGTRSSDFGSQIEAALPALRSFAHKLSRGRHDADDMVQETLVRALAARKSFDGANMRAWLFTILKNHFFNELRKCSLRRRDMDRVAFSSCGVWVAERPQPPDSRWSGQDAMTALGRLSTEFRDVVVAVEVDGLLYKEAAERLGCPVGTIMSRLHRARAACARFGAADGV